MSSSQLASGSVSVIEEKMEVYLAVDQKQFRSLDLVFSPRSKMYRTFWQTIGLLVFGLSLVCLAHWATC